MCGIAGLIRFGQPVSEDDSKLVRGMCADMAHRGPDGEGIELLSAAVLGHRRLAVIDLTDSARQPMPNEACDIWVVFNGEIYNHRSIREELIKAGHQFRSQSDTEVLLHGFEEWGMRGLILQLRGMFAFGLWDSRTNDLWLVRDRFGVKPLCYIETSTAICFSSEIRSLFRLQTPTINKINISALDFFLVFGFTPPDISIVKGIEKVPPATAIHFSPCGKEVWRYWTLPESDDSFTLNASAREELLNGIRDAVEIRLQSDVPLGCFLSGGIDSGLITAMASSSTSSPLSTITCGFEGANEEEDERPLARLVSQRYRTNQEEISVSKNDIALLYRLAWLAGEPFGDSSLVPTAAVCKAARSKVTVALTGDGGDEFFGGYYRVLATYWGERVRRVLGKRASSLMAKGARAFDTFRPARRAATVLECGILPFLDLYAERGAVFSTKERLELYKPSWKTAFDGIGAREIVSKKAAEYSGLPKEEQYARLDIDLRLAGDYLVKVDVASNAFSLECRSPFLDQCLAENVSRVPLALKFSGGRQKGLLRKIATPFLPRELIRGRKKGFATSVGTWLIAEDGGFLGKLFPLQLCNQDGPLCGATVEEWIRRYQKGELSLEGKIWTLMCLEIWWRLFVTHTLSSDGY